MPLPRSGNADDRALYDTYLGEAATKLDRLLAVFAEVSAARKQHRMTHVGLWFQRNVCLEKLRALNVLAEDIMAEDEEAGEPADAFLEAIRNIVCREGPDFRLVTPDDLAGAPAADADADAEQEWEEY